MFLSQLSEESLDLLALVSSMPRPGDVLEVRLGQTVVAIVAEKASQRHSITKLNSRFEFHRSLVNQILNVNRFDSLAPLKELFWC